MKNTSQHLIVEAPRRHPRVVMTIGIDLGDVWSHYCKLNQDGEVVDRGRFRTTPKGIEKWFTDVPPARVAMEAGTHSIWISEQLQELGHEVIVANVRELRAISHSDRKSDQVDAEKLARYARLDPEILRPIAHRSVEQQEALTLTLGSKERFKQSRDVGCYLGLRPRRSQSGDRDPQLGITKAGNVYLRSLLIECAGHTSIAKASTSSSRTASSRTYECLRSTPST
jgi:transposase